MAEKSILSQLHPRPSFDNSSVEITAVDPKARGLQSISSKSHTKFHHHHHHKRTDQTQWEIREDLQRKMKEVKQKITELEAHGYQESVCNINSKRQPVNLKRSSLTVYPSGTLKILARSLSEGSLQRRRNRTESQKLCPSRKSIICQTCNLRLSHQEELLKFVSAQHQQVLLMMQEIKAELQLIKNDKGLEQFYKRRAESLSEIESSEVVDVILPAIEQTKFQQEQDTGFADCIKQICGAQTEDTSKDFNACISQTKETENTENTVTSSHFITATAEQQENHLPAVKAIQIHKDPKKKENVERVNRIKGSSQKNLKKHNTNQYNSDSDANSTCSAKYSTKFSSQEANVKCRVPQPSFSKDTRTPLRQRKVYAKSFSSETSDKIKNFPQKETLVPLIRSNANNQADKSATVHQKTATSVCSTSRAFGHKDGEATNDSQNRRIKPLKLLKASSPRQAQNKDKDDISSVGSTKEDWKVNGNQVNINTISSPNVNIAEDGSQDSLGELINESESSPTSQICIETSTETNWNAESNLDGEKEAQCGYPYSSTSTEPGSTDKASKNQGRKYKLGKLLKTKKGALFGSSGTSTSFKNPPALNRDSISSLTFVIEKSKSNTSAINQEDKVIPENTALENDSPCQYNLTDTKKAPHVYSTSYTTPSLSFGGDCSMSLVPERAVDQVVSSAGRNLGRVLTKKSICFDKRSSGQSHCSSDKIPPSKIFSNKQQRMDDDKLAVTAALKKDVRIETNSNWIAFVQEGQPRSQAPELEQLHKGPQHTLVFWDGESFLIGEEARRHMDALTCICLHQDKKENPNKMSDVEDATSQEARSTGAEKFPVRDYNARNIPRNYMQERYVNPNFHFIATSEASITPWYGKPGSSPRAALEPMGSEVDMQEIELSLSFDDLEYLLIHKIKKQEQKNNLIQVEALKKTLNAVRQCFKAQKEFLKDSCDAVQSPRQTLSRIKTVILSPRNFVSGQHVPICPV